VQGKISDITAMGHPIHFMFRSTTVGFFWVEWCYFWLDQSQDGDRPPSWKFRMTLSPQVRIIGSRVGFLGSADFEPNPISGRTPCCKIFNEYISGSTFMKLGAGLYEYGRVRYNAQGVIRLVTNDNLKHFLLFVKSVRTQKPNKTSLERRNYYTLV